MIIQHQREVKRGGNRRRVMKCVTCARGASTRNADVRWNAGHRGAEGAMESGAVIWGDVACREAETVGESAIATGTLNGRRSGSDGDGVCVNHHEE
jgi:hypothetical protein